MADVAAKRIRWFRGAAQYVIGQQETVNSMRGPRRQIVREFMVGASLVSACCGVLAGSVGIRSGTGSLGGSANWDGSPGGAEVALVSPGPVCRLSAGSGQGVLPRSGPGRRGDPLVDRRRALPGYPDRTGVCFLHGVALRCPRAAGAWRTDRPSGADYAEVGHAARDAAGVGNRRARRT